MGKKLAVGLVVVVGVLAYSRYAYSVVSTDQKVELEANYENAQKEISQLRDKLNQTRKDYYDSKKKRHDALLLMFPDEADQNRINNLFAEPVQEEADTEETTEDNAEEAAASTETEEG